MSDLFVHDRASGTTVRASIEDAGDWMAPSRAPSLDASGRVVFASRHPRNATDVNNDDDLYVWMRAADKL